jgi:ligand-binding sensor domain-containing protein
MFRKEGITIFILALCYLPCILLFAQTGHLPSSFYSLNEGLSDRLIRDIYQNRQGYLWLATSNGMDKFDGYQFTSYNNDWDSPFKISDKEPKMIREDQFGNLVLIYPNNITFFDLLNPVNNKLTKVSLAFESKIKGIVQKIFLNREGAIFVLSQSDRNGIYLYQYKNEKFELLFNREESYHLRDLSFDILALQDGTFLIKDTEYGLRLFDRNGSLLKKFASAAFNFTLEEEAFLSKPAVFHEDRSGNIWLGFQKSKGIFFLKKGEGSFQQPFFLPQEKRLSKIWEDEIGNILLAVTANPNNVPFIDQMFCVTPQHQVHDYSYFLDISPYIISVFSKNFFQTLYLGIDTGLKVVQNNKYKVQTYLAQDLDPDQRGHVIRGITSDNKGDIYFVREVDAWYKLDTSTKLVDTVPIFDERTGKSIKVSCSMDIAFDNEGYLWGIACEDGVNGILLRYDTSSCNARLYNFPHQFNTFTIAKDGRIWLAYSSPTEKGGLTSFSPTSEEFNEFVDQEGTNPLKNAVPRYILETDDRLLWVGTESGLYKIDKALHKTTNFSAKAGPNSTGISSNVIWVIHEAKDGKLWLGTSKGLNIFDPKTEKVKRFDKRDGLASNLICGILPDDIGNYWLSTYNGLSYFNVTNKLFRNFYRSDGLSHDEFNRFAFYRDTLGRYYFGGVNGLNVFRPKDMLLSKQMPPVLLTKFIRSNSQSDSLIIQETNLDQKTSLYISPLDNYFQIHFTIPEFSNPSKNQYKVWLEGYEKDWSFLGTTPYVRYNRLPAGTYYLHLKGADSNGNWSKQDTIIKIEVGQIVYKRWWFILLVLLLLLGVVFAIFKYQLEQQLQVERFRTKLSSDLHDEVSGLLSGIAMQTDVLQMLVKDEIWSIDSRKDKIEDFINRMQEHADDILLPLNIHYDLHIGQIDMSQKIPVGIRQDLYFIYKESINNVAKHSNASRVNIELGNVGYHFEMLIKDNGNGQNEAKMNGSNKKGQGISNLKMRAKRIQADLILENNRGYTVQLKMKKFT